MASKWTTLFGIAPDWNNKTKAGRSLKYWRIGNTEGQEAAEKMVEDFNQKLKAANIVGEARIRKSDVIEAWRDACDINVMVYIKE